MSCLQWRPRSNPFQKTPPLLSHLLLPIRLLVLVLDLNLNLRPSLSLRPRLSLNPRPNPSRNRNHNRHRNRNHNRNPSGRNHRSMESRITSTYSTKTSRRPILWMPCSVRWDSILLVTTTMYISLSDYDVHTDSSLFRLTILATQMTSN